MVLGRPRLLLLITEDWHFWSHRLDLARAAHRAGFEVLVATRVTAHADRIRAAGLTVCPLRLLRRGAPSGRDLPALLEIARLYRRVRPDVVHHVAVKPVVYGSWAARLVRVPHVVNAIAGLGSSFIGSVVGAGLLQTAMKRVLRSALTAPRSRVIFQNRDDLNYFKQSGMLGDAQALIIRGAGVNLSLFSASPEPTGTPVVMLPARMLWDKGVGEFVTAARSVAARGIAARFVLVGMVDPRNLTGISEDRLRAWHAERVVEWWGHSDDMPRTLQAANIVVLPSYREGLPKVLLEAAASGRAIVATDVPGCREVVCHGMNGYLVPPRDAAALAAAITTLVSDVALRVKAGRLGREIVVSEFSSDRIARDTIAVYHELLADGAGYLEDCQTSA